MKKTGINKTTVSIALAIGTICLSNVAIAQNSMLAKNNLINAQAAEIKVNTTQVGSSSEAWPTLKGFAKDLPLIDVLHQVTPHGWVVKKATGKTINIKKPVSWQGGKNWIETLNSIAVENNLNVVIDWNKKEITLSEIISSDVVLVPVVMTPVVTNQQVGVFEFSIGEVAPLPETVAVLTVKPIEVPQPVFSMKGFESLKDVVQAWGKQAGFKIVFTGENYPIDSEDERTFTGAFESEDGAIKQLSIDYGPKSRVRQPLSFLFYQNRTLLIENLRYEQAGNPQFNK
jgi:hypothetical protein